jgi:soluble lytic murein transglycosylase-like protein
VTATPSQQERAEAAMQNSLAAQQAATATFRTNGEPDSLKSQSESVARQAGSIEGGIESMGSTGSETPSDAGITKTFFSLPWSPSMPLGVPNVQLIDDSCRPMAQDEVDELIRSTAQKQGLEASLLKSVMRQESAFKPCAVSTAGAIGLMQLMPETADMLGLDDPFDPAKNAEAGARFLKMMLDRYQGDIPMALGAYNAGPARVDKAGGVPPISETMQYVTNILRSLSLAY